MGWIPHPQYQPHVNGLVGVTEYFSSADQQYAQMRFANGIRMTFSTDASNLWISAPSQFSFEYVVAALLGPGLGFYLSMRRKTCLHASAVAVDDQAILFCAPSGYGKSTTALYFGTQGHPIISDDISLLDYHDNQVYVVPAYPQIRIWDDEGLAQQVELQPLAPDRPKKYLNLDHSQGFAFAQKSLPVGAVYFLIGQASTFTVEQLDDRQSLAALLRNTFLARVAPSALRIAEVAVFTKLIATVPVSRLLRPPNLELLPELYKFILDDLRRLRFAVPDNNASGR